MWDLGSLDGGDLGSGDRLWSRLGVKGSTKLDGGLTAGLTIEKRLDTFRTRHQNVWLKGDFGQFTFGQQGTVYHGSAAADGSNYFGGNQRNAPSRAQGIKYSSSLGGPFNFSVMVSDDGSDSGYGEGLDIVEFGGALVAGSVTIKAGYRDGANEDNNTLGGSVSGAAGPLSFKLAYETGEMVAKDADKDSDSFGKFFDADGFAGHLGYGLSDAGTAYIQYENYDADKDSLDGDYWILGYSHSLGAGVNVTAEHLRSETGMNDKEMDKTGIVLSVSF